MIESFCLDIKNEIIKIIGDLPQKKRKCSAKKKTTHSKKYRGYYISENEITDSELRFYVYLYQKILGCKFVDVKPIELILKNIKYLELGYEIRVHKYQWIFSSKDFNSIRDYIIRNGIIKNGNLTISSFSTEQIQISIYSGLNLNLCNKKLLDIGLKQLRESLGRTDIPFVDKVMFEAKVRYEILNSDTSVELGNPIIKPTTLKEIKKHFVIAKVYNLKDKVKFWIDTSRRKFDKLNPFELDFKFKIRLSKLFGIIKLMDEFKLYCKLKSIGIALIESFDITALNEPDRQSQNDFLLVYRIFSEINDFYGFGYSSRYRKDSIFNFT